MAAVPDSRRTRSATSAWSRTTKPAVTKPAVTKPAVTKPAVTKPAVTKPAVTTTAVTKPAVTTTAVAPAGGRSTGRTKPDAAAAAAAPGASSPEGNDIGIDPHKKTLTASVLDRRGGVLGTASFAVSGDGHRALETWGASFGPVRRFGIEGASGLGRHSAMY